MHPDRRAAARRATAGTVGFGVLVLALAAAAAAPAPLPYRLRIVAEASGPAAASLREDLVVRVAGGLVRQRCFAATTAGEPGDEEVVLTLRVSEVVQEIQHGQTLADRLNPRDPSAALDVVARFGMTLSVELTRRADGASLRRKRFHVEHRYRPLLESEDAAQRAYDLALADAARDATRAVCRSPRDLGRRIAAASPR